MISLIFVIPIKFYESQRLYFKDFAVILFLSSRLQYVMQKYSNKKIEIQYLVCSSFGHLVSVLYCVVTDVVYDVAMSQKSGSSVHKSTIYWS